MARFIVGDIHAAFDKLVDVLNKASFDNEKDTLYSVGDLTDRGDKPVETIEFLMGLRDFRPVLGNHDAFLEQYLVSGNKPSLWLHHNGGEITVNEIEKKRAPMWRWETALWFKEFPIIRVEEKDIIVHGGIPSEYNDKELETLSKRRRSFPFFDKTLTARADEDYLEDFLWDRDYLYSALYDAGVKEAYNLIKIELLPIETKKTIWIGHTPLRSGDPFINKKYHLVALDTAAVQYKLTLVNMDTHEYFQSDIE